LEQLLSRRVPLDGPPPTAVPAHVQPQNRPIVRSQSPVVTSRPSSPAPFKVRGTQSSRPQSPMTVAGAAPPSQAGRPEITASLLIRHLPSRHDIYVREPFRVGYTLTLATTLDSGALEALGITIQFLELRNGEALTTREEAPATGAPGTPMGSPTGTPVRGSFNWNELVPSPIAASKDDEQGRDGGLVEYPDPFIDRPLVSTVDGCAEYIGTCILPLPPLWASPGRNEHSFDFDADFISVRKGLLQVGGGLRVLDSEQHVLAEWPSIGQIMVN